MKKQIIYSLTLIAIVISLSTISSCGEDAPAISNPDVRAEPNIVLLIGDDMGWDAFGNLSGTNGMKANTPTLDSLASAGITFQNFWSNPLCSPTRAAMLTGKYGFRTGVGGVTNPSQEKIQSNETILQKYISDETSGAYNTALIGKWHVTSSTNLSAPEVFGIDYFSGIFLGAVGDYFSWTQTSNGQQETIETYATTHFINQSLDWIRTQTKPFFLTVAFNAPHAPFHLPPTTLITDQSLSGSQATINQEPLPYFLAAIEAMDTEIKRLINGMTATQRENTVFIFFGDNGTPPQVAQAPYNSTSAKNSLYEGGINTPLIITGKNVSRTNTVELALAQAPDLFATISALAGINTVTYEDGVSLVPLLNDANADQRDFIYSEQFGNGSSDSDGYAIRNNTYKLIVLENEVELLFNLSEDPFEQTNLLDRSLSPTEEENLAQLKALKAGL